MAETHPEKRLIGYARVSTYGQTLDSQLEQLGAAGCSSRSIYREKVTGARPDRRALNRMLGKLAAGDVVTVTRIDRLARSTFDLFGIVKRIVDAKAQFRSLAEPWADTGTSTGRLMLAVLGGLADVERDLIRTRTAEGRSRAKARGKHIGHPPSLTPEQQKEATRRRAQGATLKELADGYDRSIATMRRVTRAAEETSEVITPASPSGKSPFGGNGERLMLESRQRRGAKPVH
jgi:DNA invertase Pin-like site-specific DNA recombinase